MNIKRPALTKSAKKAPSLSAGDSRPQLVLSDKVSVPEHQAEALPAVHPPLSDPVPLVMAINEGQAEEGHAEGRADDQALELVAANHELATDPHDGFEPDILAKAPLPAGEPALTDPVSDPGAERPDSLQALAVHLRSLFRILAQTWAWALQKMKSHQVRKRLRVCESVSLGDKRFIAVIQVDGEQFLVGGSSSSVSTLAHLEPRREFSEVFRGRCEQDLSHA